MTVIRGVFFLNECWTDPVFFSITHPPTKVAPYPIPNARVAQG